MERVTSLLDGLQHMRNRAEQGALRVVLGVINRLLLQHTAQGHAGLQTHAGQRVRLRWEGRPADVMIEPQGTLTVMAPMQDAERLDADFDLCITITMAQVMDAVSKGQPPTRARAQLQGDMALARALSDVMQALRWDFESDFIRLFGDVLGVRLARLLQDVLDQTSYLRKRARQDFQAWLEENARDGSIHGLLTQREFETFRDEVRALRDAVARSEQRWQVSPRSP